MDNFFALVKSMPITNCLNNQQSTGLEVAESSRREKPLLSASFLATLAGFG